MTSGEELVTSNVIHDVIPKDGLPTEIDAYPIAFVCNTHDYVRPGERCSWAVIDAAKTYVGSNFSTRRIPRTPE